MERHEAGETYVVPILLRPVAGWKRLPFAKLQVYPSGGIPITEWSNQDRAFVDVAEGIQAAVDQLLEKRDRERQEQERRVLEKLRKEQEQERRKAEEIRRQQEEQARQAEQARLVEQAKIRKAEQQLENQRQEQIRVEKRRQAEAEKARRAEEAKRSEEVKRARQLEEARQTVPPERSHLPEKRQPLVTPVPQTVDRNRRQFLQWLGWVSGGFALVLVGNVLKNGRSPALKSFSFEVVIVNAKGEEAPRQTKKAKAFVEDLGNGVTLEMVAIPGGTFQMGSPAGEKGRDNDESPQHTVTIPAFFMGRYAVTQAQYEGMMGKNPSRSKGAKRPVGSVSWNDAQAFCKKLSQKTGRIYRLASEAEWEYACRAGTTTPFHFGETITSTLANYDGTYTYQSEPEGEYREQTVDVDSFLPNAFGLYSMHGNVWEWCEDIYHKNYEGEPTNESAWKAGREMDTRLLRGGSWYGSPGGCRSANRHRRSSGYLAQDIGFRVVAVLS
ncbi:MAG: SUMF1/EgtB/PvdO family nonheme iron enzyme [Timaviella obliquedivisa GSE-PSE-MK23-08B]|nr:SUMF1/EgtB/PvdO family nonheme iron enzyme [Timaviella obliquedivisa GSE-PSE-MK23-08B]